MCNLKKKIRKRTTKIFVDEIFDIQIQLFFSVRIESDVKRSLYNIKYRKYKINFYINIKWSFGQKGSAKGQFF